MLDRDFDRQMAFLALHFDCLPISDLIARVRESSMTLNARPLAAITFDDGYADNYEVAWPVLRKYAIPAAIFLIGDVYERKQLPWLVRLRLLFSRSAPAVVSSTLPPGATLGETPAGREAVVRLWTQFLSQASADKREDSLAELSLRLNVTTSEQVDDVMLSRSQVAEMRDGGITFGSHTQTHPNLAYRPLDEARLEIEHSRHSLKSHLKVSPTVLAYPNPGSLRPHVTNELAAAVEQSGYDAALTSESGAATGATSMFRLPRVGVGRSVSAIELFAWKLHRVCCRSLPFDDGRALV
jgi:peptidoglycan/xylan/chitin deacetylase (PgdA/CDA1 family)